MWEAQLSCTTTSVELGRAQQKWLFGGLQLQAFLQSQGCKEGGFHESGAWPARQPQSSPRYIAYDPDSLVRLQYTSVHYSMHLTATHCGIFILASLYGSAGMANCFSSSYHAVAYPQIQLLAFPHQCCVLLHTADQ